MSTRQQLQTSSWKDVCGSWSCPTELYFGLCHPLWLLCWWQPWLYAQVKNPENKDMPKTGNFYVKLHCLIRNIFHEKMFNSQSLHFPVKMHWLIFTIFFLFYRSSRHHSGDYSEETGYVYRASATPDYPTAPPYNPEYPAHQNPYIAEQYPTGVIPPTAEYRQPLIQQQPPPYHDVITARR